MLWRLGELARFPMMPWTTQEISLLIGLWPRISRANLEMVEPLARIGMWKSDAAAQR